jgi:hypothetical protein
VSSIVAAVEVDAAPQLGVRNSQPEGIGRVARVGELVCWNNLGRNVVFADRSFRPCAVFGTTVYPGEDEPSQYDLDVHAILDAPDLGLVLVLNHFGMLRGFRRDDLVSRGGVRYVEPVARWSFLPDVERSVVAAGRLIGSRPRSEGGAGVVVSAPLPAVAPDGRLPGQLCGTGFGEVTALAAVPSSGDPAIVVGGDGRLALVPLRGDALAAPQWERDVGFRVAVIEWHAGALWAAGPAPGGAGDDYDWDRLGGGAFAAFDLRGHPLASSSLPPDVAWGTGGCAVAFGAVVMAACRTGSVRLLDPRRGVTVASTRVLSETSLGIAHLAVVDGRVIWGFNRGGYRLHASSPLAPGTA